MPHLVAVLKEPNGLPTTKTCAASTLALLSTAPLEEGGAGGGGSGGGGGGGGGASPAAAASPATDKEKDKEKDKDKEEAVAEKGGDQTTIAKIKAAEREKKAAAEAKLGEERAKSVIRAKAVAAAGAIPPLVGLMRGECGLEAQKEAVRALYALADDEQNRRSIAEGGGIDPLMDLLHSPDQVMRKHAEGTLARLSLVDSNQMLIIKQLVGMLEKEATGSEQAAACLANLACELPQSRDSIVEAGGIPRLLALLISGSAKIKAHALSAIAELALGNQKIQNLVGSDPNGIPALVATITNATAKETSTRSR